MAEDKLGNWLSKEGLFGKKTEAEKPKAAAKSVEKKESARPAQKNSQGRSATNRSNGGRGGRPGRPNLNGKPTNNDPTHHRPTAEKRDKFHPTNFIKGGGKGDIRVVPIGGML